MFKLVVFPVLAVALFQVVFGQDKYTTKFDNVNVDDVLASDRLVGNYVKCFKGEGPCTPDGAEVKRLIPEALQNNCEKCHEHQKDNALKVISHLINKRKDVWEDLKSTFDPTGEFTENYKKNYSEILKDA